ncbi:carbohydrate-binding protein [Jiangella aurantiaca]|uniref:Carbohydrate-binding protein n=1 Tax=Jiangella aurantiaca TaxID=2530373 RepID=A0A4R5AM10_9ACTN|nr:glycoside hydrolase family 3 C-terminal domain-containing protein [Jiangella aurantiaca]TDD72569.1 carbohydrate-binding protein [Jiangella aurantiaca]
MECPRSSTRSRRRCARSGRRATSCSCPDAWDTFNLYNTKGAPYAYPLERPADHDTSYPAGLSPDPDDDVAVRNTTGALLLIAGLTNFNDGNGAGFNGALAARNAVQSGVLGVSMDHVDRVVRDWLAYKIRTGALDGETNPYNSSVIPPNPTPNQLESSKELALLAAREQIVLLKNRDGVLTLDPRQVRTLAVVGPLADVNLRDYYSPRPPARVTPLQGIVDKLGADRVRFDNGTDVVAWQSVAHGTFVTNGTGNAPMTAAFTPANAPIERGYQLADGSHVGPGQAFHDYDWGFDQHMFRSVATGNYVNSNQAIVNNATELRTSQATMVDNNIWNINVNFHHLRNEDGTRSIYGVDYIQDDQFYRWFTNGRYVQADSDVQRTLRPTLTYDAFAAGDETVRAPAKFTEHLLESGAERAAAAAGAADYAVVVIGNHVLTNARESQDRPGLALSPQHAELVRATAAARPGRTVVVIVSSYPFAVKEIEDNPDVAPVLYTSHAGQAAGTALADVLFGDYAPAGRLSATWLVDESSLPAMGPDADGHDDHYTVDMLEYDVISSKRTYRYSDAPHVYPFGHGLTYTEFRYHDLSYRRLANADAPFEVGFGLTNTGATTSDEVVQVYLRSRDSAYGDRVPRKQLVGFQRVKAIAPGETRRVSIRVDPQDMFVWDVVRQRPVVETGDHDLMVGASSEDIRLDGLLFIKGERIGGLDLTTVRNAWEHYTMSSGITHWEVSKRNTLQRAGGYHSVGSRRDGDWIGFTKVLLNGVNGIELRVATTTHDWADLTGAAIDIRIDAPDGPRLGTVAVGPTDGLQDFVTLRAPLPGRPGTRGSHDLYLVFRSGGIYLDTVQLLHARPRGA